MKQLMENYGFREMELPDEGVYSCVRECVARVAIWVLLRVAALRMDVLRVLLGGDQLATMFCSHTPFFTSMKPIRHFTMSPICTKM